MRTTPEACPTSPKSGKKRGPACSDYWIRVSWIIWCRNGSSPPLRPYPWSDHGGSGSPRPCCPAEDRPRHGSERIMTGCWQRAGQEGFCFKPGSIRTRSEIGACAGAGAGRARTCSPLLSQNRAAWPSSWRRLPGARSFKHRGRHHELSGVPARMLPGLCGLRFLQGMIWMHGNTVRQPSNI